MAVVRSRGNDGATYMAPAENLERSGADMGYDPFSDNPFTMVVRNWHQGEVSLDPFESLIQLHRAEALYLENEMGNAPAAAQARRAAERLERLIEAVRTRTVTYKEAAEISVWEKGTIANKVSAGALPAENRRVAIGALPIGPAVPGLQALRAVDQITAKRERAAQEPPNPHGGRKMRRNGRAFELGQRRAS